MATSFAFGNSGGAGSTSSSPFSFSTAPSAFSSSPAPAFGSASTSAITPAAPQAAKLPSEIVGKCVEEIIRDWNNGLQDRTAKFRKHATAISEWDRRILQNRNVLIRLESSGQIYTFSPIGPMPSSDGLSLTRADVAKVVETQTSLERQLELIETHQKEVDKALQSMEEEAERIFQDERVLLREDEAASARDIMYEQGEVVENELQHMTEQVKSIIQTMNSTQGGELEATDNMAPFDVAVRILDNQLRSLMWIDEKANEFSNRIQRLPNNSTAAERDSGIPRFFKNAAVNDCAVCGLSMCGIGSKCVQIS
ncbi:Nuclear pore glycoprotein p62 [Triticum urartu]|uniref:Nuclear pore glycoprotein p62 n=1 Tax=Triticum urartu TaxID=4572 RepID=M7YTG5_TRIUA|nr:Nuclear pore glycoprotein p62 [Triticum urartu]